MAGSLGQCSFKTHTHTAQGTVAETFIPINNYSSLFSHSVIYLKCSVFVGIVKFIADRNNPLFTPLGRALPGNHMACSTILIHSSVFQQTYGIR